MTWLQAFKVVLDQPAHITKGEHLSMLIGLATVMVALLAHLLLEHD